MRYLTIKTVEGVGYVIEFDGCRGYYICMTEKNALQQFRRDFGLEGKRLERI